MGKSSLLNLLLGEERVIVSPVAGTTRDAIDTQIQWHNMPVTLIDTAGIRRRGKIEPGVEKYSVLRTMKAIERADVVLLLIDARHGLKDADREMMRMLDEAAVSYQIVLTKSDKTRAGELERVRTDLADEARGHVAAHPQIAVTSAVDGVGVVELRAELAAFAAGA